MLVLSRKPGERIHIGAGITVTVVQVVGDRIKLGIEAPEQIRILRGELCPHQETASRLTVAQGPDCFEGSPAAATGHGPCTARPSRPSLP